MGGGGTTRDKGTGVERWGLRGEVWGSGAKEKMEGGRGGR